jgi:hypothetical protein
MAGDGTVYQGIPTGPKTAPKGAYITSYGTFWFVYPSGSGRSVFFDFSQQVQAPQPPVLRGFTTTWSTWLQPNWLATPIGVPGGMWGMRPGDVSPGTLKADFRRTNDPYLWTIRFNEASYPASTNLLVSCTGESSGACNAWRIEATTEHVARLEATTTSGKSVRYDEGTYRMPFAIDIFYP